MAEILSENIKTKEILDWQGIHLLHFSGSSCSQKLRIFLNYKGCLLYTSPSPRDVEESRMAACA